MAGRTTAARLAALTGAALAMAGCSSSGDGGLPHWGFVPGPDASYAAIPMSEVVLVERPDGCLVPETGGVPLAWPQGWSARRSSGAPTQVVDQDGKVVAVVGQPVMLLLVRAGRTAEDHPCLDGAEPSGVQSAAPPS
ncbi:MAG: hypothetical protein AB7H92_07665 [Microbacteriaceae bacterium]|jgi:hypothetical protein